MKVRKMAIPQLANGSCKTYFENWKTSKINFSSLMPLGLVGFTRFPSPSTNGTFLIATCCFSWLSNFLQGKCIETGISLYNGLCLQISMSQYVANSLSNAFINPLPKPHGIVKCPLNVHLKRVLFVYRFFFFYSMNLDVILFLNTIFRILYSREVFNWNAVCKSWLWVLMGSYSLFTFTHLADGFIQSDLQCIQAIHIFFVSTCAPRESNPQPLRC